MKSLKFYDLVTKKKFSSSDYTKSSQLANGRTMYFAIAISPSGKKSSRILSKADYQSD